MWSCMIRDHDYFLMNSFPALLCRTFPALALVILVTVKAQQGSEKSLLVALVHSDVVTYRTQLSIITQFVIFTFHFVYAIRHVNGLRR